MEQKINGYVTQQDLDDKTKEIEEVVIRVNDKVNKLGKSYSKFITFFINKIPE